MQLDGELACAAASPEALVRAQHCAPRLRAQGARGCGSPRGLAGRRSWEYSWGLGVAHRRRPPRAARGTHLKPAASAAWSAAGKA